MRHPHGLAVNDLAELVGLSIEGARSRIRVLKREGLLETVRGGRRGPGQQGVYRLAQGFRAAAIAAAKEWA